MVGPPPPPLPPTQLPPRLPPPFIRMIENKMKCEDDNEEKGSETTFGFVFGNVSRFLQYLDVNSPKISVRDLPLWNINVMPKSVQSQQQQGSRNKVLLFSLRGFTQPFNHYYRMDYTTCVDWSALVDVSKGYVQNDSITFEVDVNVDIVVARAKDVDEQLRWVQDSIDELKKRMNVLEERKKLLKLKKLEL